MSLDTEMEAETPLCTDVPACKVISLVVCPVTHGIVPVIPVETLASSDYDSASSISSGTSIERSIPRQKRICGVSYDQFKRAIKIKKNFLPAKFSYFWFYSARSLFAAYYILFLTSTGLDPKQAGSIHGIRMVIMTASALFWGLLADRSKKDVAILTIKFTAFALLVFSKPWIAYWISSRETTFEHREHIKDAVQDTLQTMNSTHELKDIMENTNEVITGMFEFSWMATHYKSAEVPLYVSMLVLGVASAFAGGAIHILLDSKVQQMTKECSRSKNAYGRQRLWGSVAYSVSPVFAGVVLETLPTSSVSKYMPVFYMHLVYMTLGLISCILLYRQKPKTSLVPAANNQLETKPVNYEGIGSLVRRMLKNIHMVLFFINVLFMGIGNGLQWSFQFLLMEEMGASKIMMGFCSFTQCMTESILFPIACKVIKKIGGNEMARTIGLFSYAILFAAFTWCQTPEYLMIATCAVGFGFTLYYMATMDELYYIGNPRCMTSLYAVYNSIMIGLGSGVAGIAGGITYKNYGGRALYFGGTIIYLILGALSALYTILYKRSIIPGWDKTQVYTQFSNTASYAVKTGESASNTPLPSVLKSDEAISLTMEGETTV